MTDGACVVSLPIEIISDRVRAMCPARIHRLGCPETTNTLAPRSFPTLTEAEGWLAGMGYPADVWEWCPVCMVTRPTGVASLGDLLRLAESAGPAERIDFRDSIAAFGREALPAVRAWLSNDRLGPFAMRVLVAMGPVDTQASIAGLSEAAATMSGWMQRDATAALNAQTSAAGWPQLAAQYRTVIFSGDFPYAASELAEQAKEFAFVLRQDDKWFVDTVVIGWDCEDIGPLVRRIGQRLRPPRFLPQEAWLALTTFGDDWWLDNPDAIDRFIEESHPIHEIREAWPDGTPEFVWPSTSVSSELGSSEGDGIEFNPVGWLRARGYQITDMDRAARWKVLAEAVDTQGLQPVAEYIASLVRLRRRQANGDWVFRHAIREWTYDLVRLKDTYYRGANPFPWPTTDI